MLPRKLGENRYRWDFLAEATFALRKAHDDLYDAKTDAEKREATLRMLRAGKAVAAVAYKVAEQGLDEAKVAAKHARIAKERSESAERETARARGSIYELREVMDQALSFLGSQ